MKIEELLFIIQNRVITLNIARAAAVNSGDIENVIKIDGDLLSTQITIQQLKISMEAMSTSLNS